MDGYVIRVRKDTHEIVYVSSAWGIAVDPRGRVFIAGQSDSIRSQRTTGRDASESPLPKLEKRTGVINSDKTIDTATPPITVADQMRPSPMLAVLGNPALSMKSAWMSCHRV